MLTVHDFLTRLVIDAQARAVFATTPRALLEQAGLGDMSTTDIVQATSLMLDYAPAEAVEAYRRAWQPGIDKLGAGEQHVALTYLMPFTLNGEHETEWDMAVPDIFTGLGDVDEMLRRPQANYTQENTEDSNNSTEHSSSQDTTGSNNPIGSGNELDLGGVHTAGVTGGVGDVASDLNTGTVAGNGITDIGSGDVTGRLGDLHGVGDLAGDLQGGPIGLDGGNATGAMPIDGVGGLTDQGDLTSPITSSQGPVGTFENSAGDLTGGTGDLGGLEA